MVLKGSKYQTLQIAKGSKMVQIGNKMVTYAPLSMKKVTCEPFNKTKGAKEVRNRCEKGFKNARPF